jgi:hypothetical protein
MSVTKSIAAGFLVLAAAAAALAQSTGSARGQVKDPRGNGLAGVSVTARLDGKDIKTIRSGSNGTFLMTGLEPGSYNFVFDKQGFASGLARAEIRAGVTTNLGDRLILAVDQGTLVLIRGSVFNEEGRSISGAKIELLRVNPDGSTKRLETAYSNMSGEFAFRRPEGEVTYRITASAKGVKNSKDVKVDNAAIYRLAITLNLSRK